MNSYLKEERGITLIALIITIIILVILAAVSVRAVYNMGIVNHAVNGTRAYTEAAEEEERMLGELSDYMVNLANNGGNNQQEPVEITVGVVASSTATSLADAFNATNSTLTWADINNIAKKISETTTVTKATTETLEIGYGATTYKLTPGDIFNLTDSDPLATTGSYYKVRVLGFNTDKLVGNPYGNGKQYAGISFEFVDFLKEYESATSNTDLHKMNSLATNVGGWGSSEIRTYLAGKVNVLANKDYVKTVTKEYNLGNKQAANATSSTTPVGPAEDKLWLLACSEIWAKRRESNVDYWGFCSTNESTMQGLTNEDSRYAYYVTTNATYNTSNDNLKKPSTSSARAWWLRSPIYDGADGFCCVPRTLLP